MWQPDDSSERLAVVRKPFSQLNNSAMASGVG